MRKFKKIELFPLTDFDDLNLQIASRKNFDLTNIGQEKRNEHLGKLFDIVSKNPNVIVANKVGDKTYVSTQIKSLANKKRVFSFPEPNPICIYYLSANEQLEISYSLKNKLFSEEQHFNSDYYYDKFIEYYKETSLGVILLITTIEGFINQLLVDNLELEINGKRLTKNKIEWLDLNTKIRQVIPQLLEIDFQQTNPKEYDNICLIIDLRNDLIHLKRSVKSNITNYQTLFKRLIDFDHIGCSDAIFTFINTIIPDYLTEKE